jgi:hypothetical protein
MNPTVTWRSPPLDLAPQDGHSEFQWMNSPADVVISVGPICTKAERDALFGQLPPSAQPIRVLIDTPVPATWGRVKDDPRRGASRARHDECASIIVASRPSVYEIAADGVVRATQNAATRA